MSFREKFPQPRRLVFPILIWLAVNYLSFYGSRMLVSALGIPTHSVELGLDGLIPFIPAFIVVYVLAFVQWLLSFLYVGGRSVDGFYRLMAAEATAKLIALVIFVVYPTQMVRPEISGSDPFSLLTSLIYSMDSPDNLFPSLHCLESWFCLRGLIRYGRVGKGLIAVELVMTLLVFCSVVLVKQHMLLDIFGGILVAELGILISDKLGLSRSFYRLERLILRN